MGVKFSGGAKLDAKLRELADKIAGGGVVRIGFLEGSTYPDGTSVPTIAAIQNFGSPANGIPPRPFFSNMVEAKSPGWGDSFARILKANAMDGRKSLALMGAGIAGQLRVSINETNTPPLSPFTIARKGFAKPLIDTGIMFQSVDFEVADA